MTRLVPLAALMLFVSAVAACGDDPPPKTANDAAQDMATKPGKQLTEPQQKAVDDAEKETGATGLGISDEILRLCPAVKPPHFATDSARVKMEYQDALVALAECMNNGNLKGKTLLLVGHADPRGEDDYNLALGGRRAESVRTALGSLGVERGRLDVTSRGEIDATGTNEEGWSKDRRVDIKIKTGS